MASKFPGSAENSASSRTTSRVHFALDFSEPSNVFKISVKAGTFVSRVVTVVTAAFDGAPTLTIGDAAAAAGFLASADIAPGTAATATVPALKDSAAIANAFQHGKLYQADDFILFTWTQGANPTAGVLKGYVELSQSVNDGLSPDATAATRL